MRVNQYFYQNTRTGQEASRLLSAWEVKMVAWVKFIKDINMVAVGDAALKETFWVTAVKGKKKYKSSHHKKII